MHQDQGRSLQRKWLHTQLQSILEQASFCPHLALPVFVGQSTHSLIRINQGWPSIPSSSMSDHFSFKRKACCRKMEKSVCNFTWPMQLFPRFCSTRLRFQLHGFAHMKPDETLWNPVQPIWQQNGEPASSDQKMSKDKESSKKEKKTPPPKANLSFTTLVSQNPQRDQQDFGWLT